jgi:hypothetical protein
MEAVRCVATNFLAKVRAEVDRVLSFGLGLKIDASCDIKRRIGRALSRLGLKPKLLFGLKWRERRRHSVVVSRFKMIATTNNSTNYYNHEGWTPKPPTMKK